jgi:hypothetical protein
MSIDNPQGLPSPEPQSGWSTKKKWVVGCGGCLGILVIFATLIAILAGMGINSLATISNQSVAAIFGPTYKPEGYMAMGLPTGSKNVKHLAMLIRTQPALLVFAAQTKLPQDQADLIRSGKIHQLQALLKQMTAEAAQSSSSGSSSKFRSLRFDQMYNLNLAPNKIYTVCNITIEMDRRGTVAYIPTSAALLPEADNEMVVLAAFNPNDASTDPEAKFDNLQKNLQEQVLKVIHDSELDDRISFSGAATQADQPPANKPGASSSGKPAGHTH